MTHYPPRQAVLVTDPMVEPVTLAEAKLFLRLDTTDEDTLITSLMTVAREMAERHMGKVLVTQAWKLTQPYIAGQEVALVPAPVQSIVSVKTELNGELTTLDASAYRFEVESSRLIFATMHSADKIQIEMVCGYGAAENVPAPIRQGILHMISHLYHHREAPAQISAEAATLWDAYSEVRL